MATFGKTRSCNHLSYLSSCLRYKVIPIGFRLHLQGIFEEVNFFRNDYNEHLYQCSRNLMRPSIETMPYRKHLLHNEVVYYKSSRIDSANNSANTKLLIHTLNRRLYQCMKEVKTYRLGRLLP